MALQAYVVLVWVRGLKSELGEDMPSTAEHGSTRTVTRSCWPPSLPYL